MITKVYIGICLAIFVYINFISKENKTGTALKLGAMYPPRISEHHEYYRFIMANFIHIDFLHCFMNMYCIYYLGGFFESLLGTIWYLYLLFFSMIFTSLTTYLVSLYYPRFRETITIGASGVFYGYLGAMIALGLFLGGSYMTLLQNSLYMILINIAFTLMNRNISKSGHLGGLIGGYLSMYILFLIGII